MGIIYNNAALLYQAKRNQVSFDSVLTIGRQSLYVTPQQIRDLAQLGGLDVDHSQFAYGKYAEPFFEQFLDAKDIQSLDCSAYQDCHIVHDMNLPVPAEHHQRFDAVIDGGSLEHVFNVPVALSNCMNLVKLGGSLFIFTMANNHLGHGFYQFSPELFYRIFGPENGFEVRDVILEKHPYPGAEKSSRTQCYRVIDPADVKQRVGLVCNSPVMVMVHAVRTHLKPVLSTFPIQSDYVSTHQRETSGGSNHLNGESVTKKMFHRLPLSMRNYISGRRKLREYSFRNRRFYEKWRPD